MLYLVFDRGTQELVPYNDSAIELPSLFQTNTIALKLQFVDQDDSAVSGSYIVADVSTQNSRVTISRTATGISGDETSLMVAQSVETAFTWDSTNKWFTGNLILDTSEMDTWIGSQPKAVGVFEVNLTTGGANPQTMFQASVTVEANIDRIGSTPPTPVNGTGGTLALQDGVGGVTIAGTLVTVAGLAWGAIPNAVLVFVHEQNSGDGILLANVVYSSITAAGFQFDLSAAPPNNNYKFTYIPVFNAPAF